MKTKKKKVLTDKTLRGNASQFFVAGELCRRGWVAVVTLGNCPNTDVLCSNRQGTKFVHIQVKTFVPGKSITCSVGRKAEIDYGSNFFWILSGVPLPGSSRPHEYYIIPSTVMAQKVSVGHQSWLARPGKNGQPHRDTTIRTVHLPERRRGGDWDISQFKEAWPLIEEVLK